MRTEKPSVWFLVVCRRPSDFPDHYTMRVQGTTRDGDTIAGTFCGLYDTLDEARADVPEEAVNLGRMPPDDPVIEEVWIL